MHRDIWTAWEHNRTRARRNARIAAVFAGLVAELADRPSTAPVDRRAGLLAAARAEDPDVVRRAGGPVATWRGYEAGRYRPDARRVLARTRVLPDPVAFLDAWSEARARR